MSFPYPAGKLPARELARLLDLYTQRDDRVVVGPGIGRDAAVISFPDRYLVAKTDPVTFATDQIGWYAVHVNANDVAAMGGTPRWFLATILLPEGKPGSVEVEAIFSQIFKACQELGVALCGGHTEITCGLDRPIVVGQMLGEVAKDKLVISERICPGDEILLTKGIAIEGTALVAREHKGIQGLLGEEETQRCRDLLQNPGISVVREARIAIGVAEVHAMHDPTEGGLAVGLHELAQASGVGLTVIMEKIPILPETVRLCRELKLDPLGLISSGALLIVAPAPEVKKIEAALRAEGIRVAQIGQMGEAGTGVKLSQHGQIADLPYFNRDEVARLFAGGQ